MTFLSAEGRRSLLTITRTSLESYVRERHPPRVESEGHPQELRRVAATFVTLRRDGRLRGCIGRLEASRPLVVDAAENGVRAAVADPRFVPVTPPELFDLEVEISVLGDLEPAPFGSEEEAVAALEPGVTGALLRVGHRVGTFLPSVWEQLPEPELFFDHLKRKAGLPAGPLPKGAELFHYQVEKIF